MMAWSLRADILSAGSSSVTVGATFVVPVAIAGTSDLYAFQFDATYDPTILQLLSINEGPFLATAGNTFFIPGTIDNVSGDATFTADTLLGPGPGAAGSGTLATLDFQAIASGTSALSLANVILLDSNLNNLAFTTSDGSITVSAPVTGTVPEPNSITLLAGVLGCLAVVRFRKYKRRAH
jgi:hypothetical protein